MMIISRLASIACIAFLSSGPVSASDTDELTKMLHAFLAAADKEAVHASFWAEDLVYTSSSGARFGKAEIMADFAEVDDDQEDTSDEEALSYSGEDVDIRVYGETAIVAFKLVGRPTDESEDSNVLYYFNTGTFLKRDGVWQVVAWQATKIPPQ